MQVSAMLQVVNSPELTKEDESGLACRNHYEQLRPKNWRMVEEPRAYPMQGKQCD